MDSTSLDPFYSFRSEVLKQNLILDGLKAKVVEIEGERTEAARLLTLWYNDDPRDADEQGLVADRGPSQSLPR